MHIMSSPLIRQFYDRHTEMIRYLEAARELSFVSSLNDTFRRSLLLAIASYFEHRITHMMLQVPVKLANGHPMISALIERQVVTRKYHQFFDWEKANVNKFLSMFGDGFSKSTQKKLQTQMKLLQERIPSCNWEMPVTNLFMEILQVSQ